MVNDNQTLNDPRGRVVAVMDQHDQGTAAKKALVEIGLQPDEIQIIDGRTEAASIDDSAKWFADTDELLERYKQKLAAGATLISAPVNDESQLKEIQGIFYAAGAHSMTKFGTLVTRTVDLDHPESEQPLDDK